MERVHMKIVLQVTLSLHGDVSSGPHQWQRRNAQCLLPRNHLEDLEETFLPTESRVIHVLHQQTISVPGRVVRVQVVSASTRASFSHTLSKNTTKQMQAKGVEGMVDEPRCGHDLLQVARTERCCSTFESSERKIQTLSLRSHHHFLNELPITFCQHQTDTLAETCCKLPGFLLRINTCRHCWTSLKQVEETTVENRGGAVRPSHETAVGISAFQNCRPPQLLAAVLH
mmetsp:Transcript_1567/g.4301  ORF Transcript_1567/g.4301 Transcript_1567/m.4301 type:complete len:228 (-) Transcript_1567:503-1186(-)